MVILSAILTGLATAGFINLTTKKNKDGSTTIFNESGQPILTVPQVTFASELPLISVKATLKRVSGITATSKSIANIKLVNNTRNNRLFHISVIPDATMKTEGTALVLVGGSSVLNIDEASLTDTDAISVPIPNEGLALNQNTTIEFFVWNRLGNPVALTALVLTGVKQSVQ